jgi:hypothetical protein
LESLQFICKNRIGKILRNRERENAKEREKCDGQKKMMKIETRHKKRERKARGLEERKQGRKQGRVMQI